MAFNKIGNNFYSYFITFFLNFSFVSWMNFHFDTYTNQSMANRRETSWTGASIALKTTSSRTKAALGTDAEDTDAAVEVNLNRTK